MTLTSLSVVLSSGATDAPALEAAAAIALREDAHLDVICLGVEPLPMAAIALGGAAPIMMDTYIAAAHDRVHTESLGRGAAAANHGASRRQQAHCRMWLWNVNEAAGDRTAR